MYSRQQQCWLDILPHSGFYYYSAFTPYWDLRYKTIQEHIVSLLSNNYCAVFVVHFWFCIWRFQYALTQRPHLNLSCPQFLNLSFYLSNTKDRRSPTKLFSTPSAAAITYTLTVPTHTHTHTRRFMCRYTTQTGKGFSGLHTNTQKQTVHSSRGFYYRCTNKSISVSLFLFF